MHRLTRLAFALTVVFAVAADLRAADKDDAAKDQPANDPAMPTRAEEVELIRTRTFGNWHWGKDFDNTMSFAKDGTYVRTGPSGERSRGSWRVEEDGTIRASDDKSFSAIVRIHLDEDRLSIAFTSDDGPIQVVASRFSGMTRAELAVYVGQQVKNLRLYPNKASVRPTGTTAPPNKRGRIGGSPLMQPNDPASRCQAAENLKALGPEAAGTAAVRELVDIVMPQGASTVKLKAIEALGEIGVPDTAWSGSNPTLAALAQVLLETADQTDPRIGESAEAWQRVAEQRAMRATADDALLKTLANVGRRLTMDDAIWLVKVHDSCSERLGIAIEIAWLESSLTKDALARELKRRHARELQDAKYWMVKLPDGRVVKQPKPPWIIWREEHPAEAEIEIQKAAAQMRENEKRLSDPRLMDTVRRDPDKVVVMPDGSERVMRKDPWEP